MSRQQRRNNVLAGLFLVGALLLTVGISFWVDKGYESLPFVNPRAEYVVRFSLVDGVAGLKPGSPVTLGGHEIGSVEEIEYAYGEGGAPEAVLVTISVDRSIRLYEDADVHVSAPLIGTLSSMNFTSVGGGAGATRLADGGEVVGGTPPPLFEVPGIPDLGGLATRAEAFLGDMQEILGEVKPEVGPITRDAGAFLSDAKSFAGDLRENQDRWFDKADSIFSGADELFGTTMPMVAEDITGGVGDARRLIGSAQGVLDENRADVRRTVQNLEGVSERVRYDILGRMESVLDEGVIAAANLGDVGSRVLGTIDRLEPPLTRTVTNFQLASSQVLLLSEEIRSAPWRAFSKPNKEIQQEEVLFGAVRRYARAVEDLRDASASLDSVLRGARLGGREVSPEQVKQMNAQLRTSFEALTEAEQDLLTLIARRTGSAPASASEATLPGLREQQ